MPHDAASLTRATRDDGMLHPAGGAVKREPGSCRRKDELADDHDIASLAGSEVACSAVALGARGATRRKKSTGQRIVRSGYSSRNTTSLIKSNRSLSRVTR